MGNTSFKKRTSRDYKGRKLSESSGYERVILVVDDEPTITNTIVLILNHSNQNLFAVGSTDLAEALSMVGGIRPDLVLLDVNMPGTIGLEHAIDIRERCGCKVLLFSGDSGTSEHVDTYIKAGGEPLEILAKPVHPTDLIERIQQMLQESPASEWKDPTQLASPVERSQDCGCLLESVEQFASANRL